MSYELYNHTTVRPFKGDELMCSLSFFDGTREYGASFSEAGGVSLLASQANWLLVLGIKTSSFFSFLSLSSSLFVSLLTDWQVYQFYHK